MASNSRIVNFDALKGAIEEKLDKTAYLEEYHEVEFFDAGGQVKACCPLPDHDDSTPSFTLQPSTGLYHCFGCKAGGDFFDLVMRLDHLEFIEAVRQVADRLEIDTEQYSRPMTDDEKRADRLRFQLTSWLKQSKTETLGRVTQETAETYGFVRPRQFDPIGEIPSFLVDKAYLMKGALTIPYRNASGSLVGFKVRHEDKRMFMTPKDFALTETVLWGFDVAREHTKDVLVVVEGELDAAVLHEHGIKNVVAIGGSNFTPEMLQFAKDMHITKLVFLLDGDTGGDTAAAKIAEAHWSDHDIQVYITQAWRGADPEDIVNAMGVDPVHELVRKAPSALEWTLRQEWNSEDRDSLTAKLDFVEWMGRKFDGRIGQARNALVMREVASWMNISEDDFFDMTRANATVLQAPDSERVVLARAMVDSNYYTAARKILMRDDFYVMKNQRLWEVLANMLMDGLEFDVVTCKQRASEQGIDGEYLDGIAALNHNNIAYHENRVLEMSVRRSSRSDADRFRSEVGDLDTPIETAIGVLTHAVTDKVLARASRTNRGMAEQVDETVEQIHQQMANPTKLRGIDLGDQFPGLTRALSGIQRRRMYTVAATSGKGKSTICIQMCTALALQSAVPVDFVSMEMDTDEILMKAASHITGIDSMKIQNGDMTKQELHRVEKALMRVRSSTLRIFAPDSLTATEFLLYCRESVLERRTELFVLDFIQQLAPDPHQRGQSKYEYLGEAAYLIKQKVCRGLDVGCITIGQLKREATSDPTPEDMGDSYEIVRASDVMLLLSETDSGNHELSVGKNRGGAGGGLTFPCIYIKETNTWREIEGSREPSYGIY